MSDDKEVGGAGTTEDIESLRVRAQGAIENLKAYLRQMGASTTPVTEAEINTLPEAQSGGRKLVFVSIFSALTQSRECFSRGEFDKCREFSEYVSFLLSIPTLPTTPHTHLIFSRILLELAEMSRQMGLTLESGKRFQ